MTPDQLTNMTTWVAIIAVASIVQLFALATIAVFTYRFYTESRRALADVERRHIEPVTQRVNEVLGKMNTEIARISRAADRVQDTVAGIHSGVNYAAAAVKSTVLPGWAVTQGVLAAVSAFRGKGRRTDEREQQRLARLESDQTRFVNEGGNDA